MKASRFVAALAMAALTTVAQSASVTVFGGDVVTMGFTYDNEPPFHTEGHLISDDGRVAQNFVMAPKMEIYMFDEGMTFISRENFNYWGDDEYTFMGLEIINKSKSMDGFVWSVVRNRSFDGFDASHIHQEGNTMRINFMGIAVAQGGRLDLRATPVPEPSTRALGALGLLAFALAFPLARARRVAAARRPG